MYLKKHGKEYLDCLDIYLRVRNPLVREDIFEWLEEVLDNLRKEEGEEGEQFKEMNQGIIRNITKLVRFRGFVVYCY